MYRTLVEATKVDVDGREYPTHYFSVRTARGALRYTCEVLLDGSDRIVFDGDSLTGLQSKVARVVPATLFSRALAAGRSAAA